MQISEPNTANTIIQGSTAAYLSTYLNQAYMDMLPWIIAAIPLIVSDLYFGINKTRSKNEKVHIMKAISMTIDKAFSYVCWILISTTLSIAFGADAIKYTIMGFVYLREVISCFRNYFNSKGYDVNEAEMFRLLWKMAVRKGEDFNDDLDKCVTKKGEQEDESK